MNPKHDPWQRLAVAARQAQPGQNEEQAPFGFSTRVVAEWRNRSLASGVNWNRFGLGALAGALAVAALCVALNYETLRSWQQEGEELAMMAQPEISL